MNEMAAMMGFLPVQCRWFLVVLASSKQPLEWKFVVSFSDIFPQAQHLATGAK